MREFIMPIVALVAGLMSLFVDSRDKTKRWIFICALALTAGLTITFNIQESIRKAKTLEYANREKNDMRQVLLNITEQTKELPNLVVWLRNFGFTEANAQSATPERVNTAFAANELYNKTLATMKQNPVSGVRVEYFPKDVDGDKISTAISSAGLTPVIKRPVRDEATNAMWVGDSVRPEDWKLVAFALLRAGVGIVSIRPFRNGTGPKAKLIQVGADASLVGLKTLTPALVSEMRGLSRLNHASLSSQINVE